ncbi:hypothetical protein CLOP_g13757 [Closterium sp. NIES-67]|nr:hypothetical protein CLOP_g13757 [Closterium sp. NIES-67]
MAELAGAAGFASAEPSHAVSLGMPENTSRSGRTLCSQCQQEPAKYRCPGCAAATCSVPCVKAHKAANGCTGKRNRAEFVPIAKFDDNQLVSDLRFLEDALVQYDVAKRTRMTLGVRYEAQVGKHWHRMQETARQRGVQLLLMPPGMSKRKANKTYFQHRKRCIMWHVRWQFAIRSICIDANSSINTQGTSNTTSSSRKGDTPGDTASLQGLSLPQSSKAAAFTSTVILLPTIDTIVSEDEALVAAAEAALRQALKAPAAAAASKAAAATAAAAAAALPTKSASAPPAVAPAVSLGEVLQRLRLQLEVPPSQLCELETSQTLRTQLAGRTILEFPTIRVSCLAKDEDSEDVGDSDEDESDSDEDDSSEEEDSEEVDTGEKVHCKS